MAAQTNDEHFAVWGEEAVSYGPMDLVSLVRWVREERVTAGTWIFDFRHGEWQRAADMVELQLFFQAKNPQRDKPEDSPYTIRGIDTRELRRLKLLGNMTDDQLGRFTQFIEVQDAPQWATIVRQGDFGDAMYLILKGEFQVRRTAGSQQINLANLCEGDFFGDIALLDRGPRSANVVAVTSGLLLRLSVAAFERLSREMPDLATPFLRAIGKTLTIRLRANHKQQSEFFKISKSLEL
jgi:hypothetical protein